MSIFDRVKQQNEEAVKLAAANKLEKPEDMRWSGLFTDRLQVRNPPGFPAEGETANYVAFLTEIVGGGQPGKNGGGKTPDMQIWMVRVRHGEDGKPIEVGPEDSHGFQIAKFWTHQGVKVTVSPEGEEIKKPYFFLSGDIVDYLDPESLKLIKSGAKTYGQAGIKVRRCRINLTTEVKRQELLQKKVMQLIQPGPEETLQERKLKALEKAKDQVPSAFVFVETFPSEKKLAQAAADQAEELRSKQAATTAATPADVEESIRF